MEYNYHVLTTWDSVDINMVPVVFITNKTFEKITDPEIPTLAKRLVRRCLPAYDSTDIGYEKRNRGYYSDTKPVPVSEIQIDCDWTRQGHGDYRDYERKNVLNKSLARQQKIDLEYYTSLVEECELYQSFTSKYATPISQ